MYHEFLRYFYEVISNQSALSAEGRCLISEKKKPTKKKRVNIWHEWPSYLSKHKIPSDCLPHFNSQKLITFTFIRGKRYLRLKAMCNSLSAILFAITIHHSAEYRVFSLC